mmetsp:Transcript_5011/g.7737  ORF Transcript_5011/g.7737 Transcript_5011/m.7737 type:complete len:386 (-) Transcript_5011:101-1258(-)
MINTNMFYVTVFYLTLSIGSIAQCTTEAFAFHSLRFHHSFTRNARTNPTILGRTHRSTALATSSAVPSVPITNDDVRYFTFKNMKLSYRIKPASAEFINEPSIILIHPVGIGLSSWFSRIFMDAWDGKSTVYAPSLIGCGIGTGATDAWDPEKQGMFFPLSWVEGVEALMHHITTPSDNTSKEALTSPRFIVMTQGGLAPVGVMLAARNRDTVKALVMASPPTWKDMVEFDTPQVQEKNFRWWSQSFFVTNVVFPSLESKWAIRFFSNLFLFSESCDEMWLEQCSDTHDDDPNYTPRTRRFPVMAFNAGLCVASRSFESELIEEISQPTWILQGADDSNRQQGRRPYEVNMKQCSVLTLPGKNVLPWEQANIVATVLTDVLKAVR